MLQVFCPLSALLPMLMNRQQPQQRRPYTMLDYQYMATHYRAGNLASCARHLGRTQGSLKSFLQDHPELQKRGRLT